MAALVNQLFSDLVRLETELWNALDARLRATHELPLTWYEPMHVMAHTPECRVQDIATALSITVGGTSKLVDRIEAAGWCERRVNPSDQRSSLLALTARGRRLCTAAEETATEELHRLLGKAATSHELLQFAHMVRRLRSALPSTNAV